MNKYNPFIGKSYASGEQFIGREKELQQLWDFINSKAGGISLYGQQRIGKTSIARKIFSKLKTQNKPVIWIDLGEKEFSASLFNEMSEEIFKLFPDNVQEIQHCLNENCSSFYSDSANTTSYRKFKNLLDIIPKTRCRIVVFLDEFDAIRDFDSIGKVPQRLRTLMDNSEELNITIVLISRRTIVALEQSLSGVSTLDGQCEKIVVKPFQKEDAYSLVANLDVKMILTEHQRNYLFSFAGYHPHLLKAALTDFWDTQDITEKARGELLAYYKKLRELLNEDELWQTLIQEVLWGMHDSTKAEAFDRLQKYGLLSYEPESCRTWSKSLDDYIIHYIKDSSLEEPWANVERRLRKLIDDTMRNSFGDEWITKICQNSSINIIFYGTSDRADCCQSRMSNAKKTLGIYSDNLLDFAYPDALWQIIQIYWQNFQEVFRQQKQSQWTSKFQFLSTIRKAIAHNYSERLSEQKIREFHMIIGELDKVLPPL
ncbi:MAG: ATP-binding protein [Planctomycetaceae bacterium]|jgi:hypothetical protein|nr:ATP-binding protein [Planctomycetaceae bacterium]